ncbi:MAG: FecCD family ABC transporter permease [Myxococcota bacterium]
MIARIAIVVGVSALALVVAPVLGPSLDPDSASFVLAQLRLPRVVLGALVGMALGVVGAVFQTLFENPLATPSTLGTTAGASLGALAVLVVVPPGLGGGWVSGTVLVGMGAFIGAGLVTLGVALLAVSRRVSLADLLLVGIAVSLAAGAVSLGLQVRADAATTYRAVRWSLGSLSTVGWWVPLGLAPVVVLGTLPLFGFTRALEAVSAGAEQAAAQGVSLRRLRWVALSAGSLVVGSCVAAVGPLAFVGLVVPHIVRLVVGDAPRRLLPLSAVVGAAFLPLADGLARVLVPGQDLPVGVLTAAIGAPALIALLLFKRRGPS